MDLKLYILVAMLCLCLQGYEATGCDKCDALKCGMVSCWNTCNIVKDCSRKSIAFHVYPSKRLAGLKRGQIVVFDNIITNEGGGYNKATGVFACPVAGIYSITIDTLAPKGLWWYIKVNNRKVGVVHTHGHDTMWNQISRTAVVKLDVGDHVFIENHVSVDAHENLSTGFSGILVS